MGTEEIVKLTLLIAINPLDLTIPPSPLSNDRATLPTTAVYTGSKQTPAIGTVKFGGLTVTHSAATYGSNLNVGDATCSIVGNGNYTGTKIFKWTITADTTTPGGAFKDKPTAPLSFNEGVVYADSALGFTAKNGTITYLYKLKGDATDFVAKKPTAHGTYTVKATISDDPNYSGDTASTATRDFTVIDLEITSLKIESVSLNGDNTYSINVALGLKGSFNHGEHFGIIVKKDGIFQKYTQTYGNITQATWAIDVGGFAVGSEYTI